MIYTENAIPQDATQLRVKDAFRYRDQFKTETYTLRGVLRWKSNQAPVPLDIFRDAYCTAPAAQADACDEYSSRAIREFLAAREHMSDDERAEELMMARAAHGPGVELVNVISGQRFTT